MYEEPEKNQESKIKIAAVAIIIASIILIIAISVIGNFINKSTTADITNESDKETEIISSEDLGRVKSQINPTMKKIYDTQESLDGVVRWNTVKEQKVDDNNSLKEFLIDFDDIRQTYRVIIDGDEVFFDCPELNLSKYPDNFCIGNYRDYNDSISVVFGDTLPLEEVTENGEPFTVNRNVTMNSMNDRYLEVYSYSCPNNDQTLERINKRIDEVITSLGANPNMFERKIFFSDCHGE